MGLFTTIETKCPHCNADIQLQSKGGDPCMETFSIEELPIVDAEDLLNNHIWNSICESCNKKFKFECEPFPKKVKGWLTKVDE